MYILYPAKIAEKWGTIWAWAYIHDNILADTWKKIIDPYEKFLNVTFKSHCDGIFELPITKVENPNSVEVHTHHELHSIWYTDNAPNDFFYATDSGMLSVLAFVEELFTREFSHRVNQLYINQFGSLCYDNTLAGINSPLDDASGIDTIKKCQESQKDLVVCAIRRNFTEFNSNNQKQVTEMSTAIGRVLSKAHFLKHSESSELFTVLDHAKSNYYKVYRDYLPHTLQIETCCSSSHIKKWYIVQLYRNDKLIVEKKGIMIHYSWMSVVTNMYEWIKKSKSGVWTMVIGVAQYPR